MAPPKEIRADRKLWQVPKRSTNCVRCHKKPDRTIHNPRFGDAFACGSCAGYLKATGWQLVALFAEGNPT